MKTIRPGSPSDTWLDAVYKARDNHDKHHTEFVIARQCWEQGFGAIPAARILDWWCSCHPDVIYKKEHGAWPPQSQEAAP